MYYIIVELWYDAPFMGRVCFDIRFSLIIMSPHPYQISMYLSSYYKTCLGVAGYSLNSSVYLIFWLRIVSQALLSNFNIEQDYSWLQQVQLCGKVALEVS